MAQFYQTAKPQFIEDMIYQPPWDLIKESLGKEQDRYDIALSKADLFNHVDVNFIDDPVERQKVEDKQNYYAQRAEEITNKLQSSTDKDWAKNLPELTKLRRELEQDYKTGDIYKIQESASQYAKMEEHLKTITDPTMKQRARESFLNQWTKNPNRSLDKGFSYNEIYDKKDITGEFLAEWTKNFPPDQISSAFATSNGRYINSGRKDVEIRKGAAEAYEKFVQAKGYEPYLKQEQDFGIGNYFEGDKLLPFTDPRSSGFAQSQYVKESDYRKESGADADKKADPYGLQNDDFKKKMALAAYTAKQPEAPISSTRDASFYYKHTPQGKAVVKAYQEAKGKLAQALGATNPSQYESYMNMIRSNPKKYPTQFKYLTTLDNTFNANQRSGTDYMKNLGFTQDQLDIVTDRFNAKGVEQSLQSKPGVLDFGTYETTNTSGKKSSKTYTNIGATKGSKVALGSMIGKTITVPGFENDPILMVEPVEGTSSFVPGTEVNGASGASMTVKITLESGKEIYPEYYISGDPLNIGF